MAKKLSDLGNGKPEGGGAGTVVAGPGHNSETVDECLVKAYKALYELEAQEEAAIAKHVKPLREAKRELKTTMKAKTAIDISDFNSSYKQYKRQEDAKLMDQEDRDRVLSNIASLNHAMASVSLMDWLKEHDDKLLHPTSADKPAKQDNQKEPEEQAATNGDG